MELLEYKPDTSELSMTMLDNELAKLTPLEPANY